jgi:integrase
MRTRLTGIKKYVDNRGKLRCYLRRQGQRDIPLPGKPGSPEFMAAYHQAVAQTPPRQTIGRSRPGSLTAAVAGYYEHPSFAGLALSTRGMRRRILEKIRATVGQEPIAALTRGHITSVILSPLKPFERNNWLKTLRGLMAYALDAGLIDSDPTIGVERSKAQAGSIHTWSEAEIAQFEARHGVGTNARLALALLLYTAQRRSDVVRMGPQHIRDGVLYVRQKKTKMEKEDRVLRIPVLPELQAVIDATPSGNLTFLVTRDGKPYSEKGFGIRFGDWVDQAGLPHGCSAHGLRKAACVRLVEAGCSISEVQAISGHRNMAQVKPYIEAVSQARLAETAMARLRTKAEKSGTESAAPNPEIANIRGSKLSSRS